MSFPVGSNVEVLIGNLWCAGVVEEVPADGCYWVDLDNPPTLAEVGKTHKYVDSSSLFNKRVFVTEAPNNFPGEEIIRSQ